MSNTVIKVENVGKQYRLGTVGTGTMMHDINRWLYRVRGKEDPYLKIGEVNDRAVKGTSEYVWSLRDISFEVKQGEVLGIIGKNGAGKSTLLKILSRVTNPTVGNVKIKGRVASLLEVGTGFHPELTGRENIFLNGAILGMTKQEIRNKFDEMVDFSGVERYIDTPVKRYSSGMYVRLAFAVAAHLEPEILIVDEVLAVGDAEFQKKCLGKMKDVSAQGRTVLFVSHNLSVINTLCKRSILLEKGYIKTVGNTNDVINEYLNFGIQGVVSHKEFNPDQKKFNILQVKLLNSKNELVKTEFDVSEKYSLYIRYKFKVNLPSVHLTVYFTNERGEIVYFLDRTDFANNYFSAEVGEYETLLTFDAPILKPGKYSITFGLADNYTGEDDHKFDVLFFEINNVSAFRGQRDGYIFKPVEWQMKKIQ